MARQRNPLRDKAKQIWLESNGETPLVDIAIKLDKSSSTIRKWKSTDKWDDELKGSAPLNKRSAPLKNNQNAIENKGGAPPNNQNAMTHGLFSKWLPDETNELMGAMQEQDPADIIWTNIEIQYAAIIRSQKIMYVEDKNDLTKEESGYSSGKVSSETYAVQFAWDKQASFLQAQSRAMGTLSNLIKQFVAIADEQDERKLKLELMQAQVDKLKSETKKSSKETTYIVDDIEDDAND
ncbi:TerS [Carnobacterium divergens]|uniref:phage terminase small subunit n=1 Tax=Carnobacterium divergens TaxID=2748 RepID=UPI0010718C13|nr:phage terminase small subunit [Carnobacterium divergens]TFJ40147.1 TerS [Carnobacterium divergens]TFJ48768.1 TerS [Carnobacterium divergens]TFJ54032.1 TerS [Carnobacterium divergens]TFJ59558.1 TerS [Carnobacterium divergens]TFJ70202.1 TerS [Carnobacterium divergens]